MLKTQEPKYDVNSEGRLFNRESGEVIPDDEPVFIFRARDRKAVAALMRYIDLCERQDHVAVVHGHIMDFVHFREAHPERMHEPDSGKAVLADQRGG